MILLTIVITYFSLGWFYSFKTNKYSWIDFLWSSSFCLTASALLVINYRPTLPALVLTFMYLFWSLRLGSYLFFRIKSHGEDKRYLPLIKRWGHKTPVYFYLVFVGQGLLSLLLISPLQYAYSSGDTGLSALQVSMTILFIASLTLETIADSQLKAFISAPENKGNVCKKGLWKYSRHPNYFFESLIWLSFSLFSLAYSPLAIIPYIIMLGLLRFVTGVPPAEKSSLTSKPDLFKVYQKETNIFIPLPTRRINHE